MTAAFYVYAMRGCARFCLPRQIQFSDHVEGPSVPAPSARLRYRTRHRSVSKKPSSRYRSGPCKTSAQDQVPDGERACPGGSQLDSRGILTLLFTHAIAGALDQRLAPESLAKGACGPPVRARASPTHSCTVRQRVHTPSRLRCRVRDHATPIGSSGVPPPQACRHPGGDRFQARAIGPSPGGRG
jgi:hypothetical protein